MTNGEIIELGSAFLALPKLVEAMTRFAHSENTVSTILTDLTKTVADLNATVTLLSDTINALKPKKANAKLRKQLPAKKPNRKAVAI